jgi:L-fuconolactonase
MAELPSRVVDCHVHLWDPARTDWYPYLGRFPVHGSGDPSRVSRRFDVATHRHESKRWNVTKVVNVAAATGRGSIDETLALDAAAGAEGGPDAIVGGLPPAGTVAESIDFLDRQMAAARFRGVRPMGLDRAVPDPAVLRALRDRDLVFELMTHPDQLRTAAEQLGDVDGLTVVVEHTGWPRSDADEERALWRDGIDALAGLGDHVVCKLSGLAMPFGSMAVDALRPWLEHALEAFGTDRCMFASNFPVDSAYGTFDDLYTTFSVVTGGFDDESRHKLFAANAERVYRLSPQGQGQ